MNEFEQQEIRDFERQEKRCRQVAAKQGLKLVKSKTRRPEDPSWQQFMIADASTGSLSEFSDIWRNLDEVEEILSN